MDSFNYRDGVLCAEDVPVRTIADALGTPTYVYSASTLRDRHRRLAAAFAPLEPQLCFAVKALNNVHVLRVLAECGAGMDVVSGWELERAWLAGVPPSRVVFAGVGKGDDEIRSALDGRYSPLSDDRTASRGPVGLFNVESDEELANISRIARELGARAEVCIRVNPDVDARTHPHTTTGLKENKFGIDIGRAQELFAKYANDEGLRIAGLHVHLGSPIYELEPFRAAVTAVVDTVRRLAADGYQVRVLNLGGGWGADYETGQTLPFSAYADTLVPPLRELTERGVRLVLEPGRAIAANAGVLLTRVRYVKEGRTRRFVVCDAGMHTLIRPLLYDAFHFIWPARVDPACVPARRAREMSLNGLVTYDVVGPLCESSDFLARGRGLPPLARGDLLAVFSAGAYGMTMSSTFNDHGRPAEVLVDGDRWTPIRRRDELADVLRPELEAKPLA